MFYYIPDSFGQTKIISEDIYHLCIRVSQVKVVIDLRQENIVVR